MFTVLNESKISSINTGSIQPTAVAFDYTTSTVVWIDEGGNTIKSIKTDGTSELTLTTGTLNYMMNKTTIKFIDMKN